MSFEHYPKGNQELGGLDESCVKIPKRMIHGCIGKQEVLNIFDSSSTLAQATCHVQSLSRIVLGIPVRAKSYRLQYPQSP